MFESIFESTDCYLPGAETCTTSNSYECIGRKIVHNCRKEGYSVDGEYIFEECTEAEAQVLFAEPMGIEDAHSPHMEANFVDPLAITDGPGWSCTEYDISNHVRHGKWLNWGTMTECFGDSDPWMVAACEWEDSRGHHYYSDLDYFYLWQAKLEEYGWDGLCEDDTYCHAPLDCSYMNDRLEYCSITECFDTCNELYTCNVDY